jgi:solute carrier family 25 (mitochondrial 2-oxodicarboxylate transporter), member 21
MQIGFIEICLMHPLDVVKTRFQVQSGANQQYSGILDCFRKTIKSEGFILVFRIFKF